MNPTHFALALASAIASLFAPDAVVSITAPTFAAEPPPVEHCYEDDPSCWSCETMGNEQCGGPTSTETIGDITITTRQITQFRDGRPAHGWKRTVSLEGRDTWSLVCDTVTVRGVSTATAIHLLNSPTDGTCEIVG